MKRLLLALGLLAAAVIPAAAQQSVAPAPHVQARLVAEQASAAPGGTVTVALEEVIRPGWHTYWVNPGDAGLATQIQWSLPAGWSAGAIQWPTPKRLPVLTLMDYGYEGRVWLLTGIKAPTNARPGDTVTLKADVSWQVCKDVCIPEEALLTLPVTIGSGAADAGVAQDFADARARLPVTSPWPMNYALGRTLDLYVAAPMLASAHPVSAAFFPLQSGMVANAAIQQMGFAQNGLVMRLMPGDKAARIGGMLTGVLVLKSIDGSVQALNVSAPPGPVPEASFAAVTADTDMTLWLALAFAFLGGLILNVMPCVLPVLAMKALALANQGAGGARREGIAYTAGVVLSFLGFGAAILLLRAGGAAIGWGFQLQSPLVVAGFALLIFAVGLNLSGLFEIGAIGIGQDWTRRGGTAGAFFTGVLAVAVAAPCTASFMMAAALGFALTQDAVSALLIFLSLGLGFAAPFLLLALWPGARAGLPRPGAWMLRFRQLMAFPMYGAAAFLVWVMAQQSGPNGMAILLAAGIALALAAWIWSVTRAVAGRWRGMGGLMALLVFTAGLYGFTLLQPAPPALQVASGGEKFTEERLDALRAQGRGVFINATADWCITCLVNEEAVLSRDSVRQLFADRHVTYMVADWTRYDPAITKLLNANGRPGVPLYLYYAPNAVAPVVLPQLLSESAIADALRN
jgi:thiol:disulfide interchange protein DsbD